MDKTDARTLPIEALNERQRRAVKMRLDGMDVEISSKPSRRARRCATKAHCAKL